MAKTTPTPWCYEPKYAAYPNDPVEVAYDIHELCEDDPPLATVYWNKADARLIVKAPDLLIMLRKVMAAPAGKEPFKEAQELLNSLKDIEVP
jgi:hypothetical protein